MDLKLNELDYQKNAVDSIASIFDEDVFIAAESENQNPYINFDNINIVNKLKQNIKAKNNVIENLKLHKEPQIDGKCLNLDVKMETGTGKTYVYTKTIYELNKRFGIKKFIILVPSLAIKEGTRSFIENSKRYFNSELEYKNYLFLYEQRDGEFGSISKNKTSATNFPESVKKYFEKGFLNNISVLITNDDYLSDNSYGLSCESSIEDKIASGNNRCPKDVIAYTKPFIIIDEPHNFADENKVMTFIREQLKPQCIIRFGATFPETEIGRGKTKEKVTDYKNLIFDLSTKEAFNKNYIKQVTIYNTDEIGSPIKNIKFTDFNKGRSLTIKYTKDNNTEKENALQVGDNLSFMGDSFADLKITSISTKTAYINNIKINKYDNKIKNDYSASDFSESFQEGMIMAGLRKHFKKEKENLNERHLIKTVCLFFISDIDLYRDRERKNETPLRDLFEKCLKNQIEEELNHINKNNKYELLYEKFLKATLENIDKNDDNLYKVHGGYFAGEANKKEDSEYDRIIKNKSKTLRLINEVGQIDIDDNGDIILTKEDGTKTKNVTFNTFRFIFSKWTLKEGWDNPNVFTIVKLRTSKSNNKKMQELGRGLRIPVDIYMNRLNNEIYDLNYIIDNKEKDFAKNLISEIYGEEGITNGNILTEEILIKIAQKLHCDEDTAFDKLREEKIIDRNYNIINVEELISKYEDCIGKNLRKGAIKQNTDDKSETVRIRKENFEKIKDLWKLLNHRYYISIDNNVFNEQDCLKIIFDALNKIDESHYINKININETYKSIDNNSNIIATDHFYVKYDKIKYNDFIIRVSRKTLIPLHIIHKGICEYANDNSVQSSKICEDFFNENVCEKLIEFINECKYDKLTEKFTYMKLNHSIMKTQLTDDNGNPLNEIQASLVGVMGEGIVGSNCPEKYLYDEIRYDSDIEKTYISDNSNKGVVVYGKIPRRSIQIPKIDGHTTSPDFMYVIKENDDCKSINLVIETKGFDKQSEGSIEEKKDREYQEKFFEQFKKDLEKEGIAFEYKYHLNDDDLNKVIDNLLKRK